MYGGYDGSASQFAGGGGGGFMPTPTGATGSSPGAAGGARGQGRAESLVPLTVKQLHASIEACSSPTSRLTAPGVHDEPYASDDVFRVNGEEVHNMTLLGKIVKASDSSTSLVYTIDDGTGKVDVKIWVDAEDGDGQASNKAEWKVGSYVRVYGHLRAFQGARGVIAFNMRPVTDFNEITYHFLEVVYCNAHNGVRAAAAAANPGASGGDHNAYAAPPPAAAAPNAAGGAGNGAASTGSCSDQVFAIFNGPQGHNDQGVHVNEVVAQVNGRFTEPQVREAVEHLVNEGHLYSTIDDDHFKSTLI